MAGRMEYMMQETMINRVLRVSPEQNELYRRNKSRIFIGVEGETLIDTILQQSQRPIEDYIDVSHRAIAQAGLSDDYGELRPVYGTQIGIFGAAHLQTQQWLKDENGNVFDLFISLDPDYEMTGEPPVEILQTTLLDDGVEGENPLILSVDIVDLISAPMGDDNGQLLEQNRDQSQDQRQEQQDDQSQQMRSQNASQNQSGGNRSGNDDQREPGAQGQVKDPNDGRLKENKDAGVHVEGHSDGDHMPGDQGAVKRPDDGRLKANRDNNVHVDDNGGNQGQQTQAQKAPAMARQNQAGDNQPAPRRGRVTNNFDRRLKGNRGMARRPQNGDDDTPNGGGAGGSGGGSAQATGGSGSRSQGGGSSGGAKAEMPTWADGRPRTIAAVKLDGTPRRKPGPAVGTKYKMAA